MSNLLRAYVRNILTEEASLSFRGSGISAEAVRKDLIRYIERLAEKFEGKTSVDIPIAKPTSSPPGAKVVDSSSGRVGKSVNIAEVSVGESFTFNLKNVDWIVYQFDGRTGPSWGAAIKERGGQYVRVDSLQKSGFFDTGKANVLQKQNSQEKSLDGSLQEIIASAGADFAYLSIGSRSIMPRITSVKTISGTPKADVEVVGVTPDESVFLSLKDGVSVKDFQQYGGITAFKDFPEVIAFAYKVWNLTSSDPEEPKRRIMSFSEVYTSEVSNKLILATVYGKDAAKKNSKFGPEKCDMLLQGTPDSVKFVQVKTKGKIPVVELVGNGHGLVFPEIPSEEFSPVLLARRDNSTTLSGFGPFAKNQGVRFLCYPSGKMTQKAIDLDDALSEVWRGSVPGDVDSNAYDSPTAASSVKKEKS